MPVRPPRINRGPAAAAQNREALLSAARELFAERGYLVPLQAIAKRAAVGQGVLYRHFPRRFDLALAVFEQNFTRLEATARDVGPGSFARVWEALMAEVVESAAFVEMAVEARRDIPDFGGNERLVALFEPHVAAAVGLGEVRDDLTAGDVLPAVRMVYGLVVTQGSGLSLSPTLDQVTRRWFGQQ